MDTWEQVVAQQRRVFKLSQRYVAAECGVTVNTVWNWEHGVSEPSPRHVRALVRVLGIDPVTLHRIYTQEPAA